MTNNTSTHVQGLSDREVQERISNGLQNSHQPSPTRSYGRIILENVFNLYNILLLLSITFLIILEGSKDIFFTTFLLLLNITVGLTQEIRAKYMVDKLSLLVPHVVTVRRNGKNSNVSTNDIVQDDVIILQPGDSIIVDGPVLDSDNLEIDESSLTGESKYIEKNVQDMMLSGSYCVAGSGLMKAQKVGKESYLNKFKQSAFTYKMNKTPLENWLKKLLRIIMVVIAIFGPLTVIAGINVQLPLSHSIENLASLLIILLPQGIITSVAVLFALGAMRISKSHAIIQRMNAIESMSHVKVLCTDKTGTLTRNELRVNKILPFDISLESIQQKLALFAHNVSAPNQIISALSHTFHSSQHVYKKKSEIPFKSERKWSGITFITVGTIILGAPEILLKNHNQLKVAAQYSKSGLRVIACAVSNEKLVSKQRNLPAQYTPIALIVFSDEVRPDVAKTIEDFRRLGIQVKIISGDDAETVHAIAIQSGIKTSSPLTQKELISMRDATFDKAIRDTTLFARIEPEMKQKIIDSLIRQDLYVAMIGDGVNDVLALKKARVSIAMNSGAQIAKDVSDIILLDNAFSTLPKAIEEGRDITQRIYAIAKIFVVKIVYFMTLFFLVGFATLPFPINLRETTLLGFIITGIPVLFIIFKILHPARKLDPSVDFVKFTLIAGLIGGLAMTYITIVTVTIFKQDIELSRTLVTIFASLYSSVVLCAIVGISLVDIDSIRHNKSAALIIFFLCLASITLPEFIFPTLFTLVRLKLYHWILLAILIAICVYILSFLNGKLHLRRIFSA